MEGTVEERFLEKLNDARRTRVSPVRSSEYLAECVVLTPELSRWLANVSEAELRDICALSSMPSACVENEPALIGLAARDIISGGGKYMDIVVDMDSGPYFSAWAEARWGESGLEDHSDEVYGQPADLIIVNIWNAVPAEMMGNINLRSAEDLAGSLGSFSENSRRHAVGHLNPACPAHEVLRRAFRKYGFVVHDIDDVTSGDEICDDDVVAGLLSNASYMVNDRPGKIFLVTGDDTWNNDRLVIYASAKACLSAGIDVVLLSWLDKLSRGYFGLAEDVGLLGNLRTTLLDGTAVARVKEDLKDPRVAISGPYVSPRSPSERSHASLGGIRAAAAVCPVARTALLPPEKALFVILDAVADRVDAVVEELRQHRRQVSHWIWWFFPTMKISACDPLGTYVSEATMGALCSNDPHMCNLGRVAEVMWSLNPDDPLSLFPEGGKVRVVSSLGLMRRHLALCPSLERLAQHPLAKSRDFPVKLLFKHTMTQSFWVENPETVKCSMRLSAMTMKPDTMDRLLSLTNTQPLVMRLGEAKDVAFAETLYPNLSTPSLYVGWWHVGEMCMPPRINCRCMRCTTKLRMPLVGSELARNERLVENAMPDGTGSTHSCVVMWLSPQFWWVTSEEEALRSKFVFVPDTRGQSYDDAVMRFATACLASIEECPSYISRVVIITERPEGVKNMIAAATHGLSPSQSPLVMYVTTPPQALILERAMQNWIKV